MSSMRGVSGVAHRRQQNAITPKADASTPQTASASNSHSQPNAVATMMSTSTAMSVAT
jgi:hypothetical protein